MSIHPALDELELALTPGLRRSHRSNEDSATAFGVGSPPTSPGLLAGHRYPTPTQVSLFEQACTLAFRQRRLCTRDKSWLTCGSNRPVCPPTGGSSGCRGPRSRQQEDTSTSLVPIRKGILGGELDMQAIGWQHTLAGGGTLKQHLTGVDMTATAYQVGETALRSLRSPSGAVLKVGHCAGGPLGPGAPLGGGAVASTTSAANADLLEVATSNGHGGISGASPEVSFETTRLASIYKLAPRLFSAPLFAEGPVGPEGQSSARQPAEDLPPSASLPRVLAAAPAEGMSLSFTENGPMIVRAVVPEPASYTAPPLVGRKDLVQVRNRRKQRAAYAQAACTFPTSVGSTTQFENQALLGTAEPGPAGYVKRSKSLPASGQSEGPSKVSRSCRLPRASPVVPSGSNAQAGVKKRTKSKKMILPFAYGDDDPRIAHLEATGDGRILPEYLP
mmetsp:Transcript_15824/g.37279  ORF Transcript_15824/g.37279 Transcript_15824/m.37279 type:complete len:446 (+) Transcript_15824:164-1501(+)